MLKIFNINYQNYKSSSSGFLSNSLIFFILDITSSVVGLDILQSSSFLNIQFNSVVWMASFTDQTRLIAHEFYTFTERLASDFYGSTYGSLKLRIMDNCHTF